VYRPIGHEDGVRYLRTVVSKLVYQGGGVDSRLRMGLFLLKKTTRLALGHTHMLSYRRQLNISFCPLYVHLVTTLNVQWLYEVSLTASDSICQFLEPYGSVSLYSSQFTSFD